MLYRILSNESDFASLLYDDLEVIEKLGDEYLIQADPSPVKYSDIWEAIHLEFVNENCKPSTKPVPDIQHHFGHLFLSERAASLLDTLIGDLGEFLPVTYGEGDKGFIFNPLKIIEADSKTSIRNEIGDVVSIGFNEDQLLFKTDFDNYYGVFCNDVFKNIVNKHQLTGVELSPDLSNVFSSFERMPADLYLIDSDTKLDRT